MRHQAKGFLIVFESTGLSDLIACFFAKHTPNFLLDSNRYSVIRLILNSVIAFASSSVQTGLLQRVFLNHVARSYHASCFVASHCVKRDATILL